MTTSPSSHHHQLTPSPSSTVSSSYSSASSASSTASSSFQNHHNSHLPAMQEKKRTSLTGGTLSPFMPSRQRGASPSSVRRCQSVRYNNKDNNTLQLQRQHLSNGLSTNGSLSYLSCHRNGVASSPSLRTRRISSTVGLDKVLIDNFSNLSSSNNSDDGNKWGSIRYKTSRVDPISLVNISIANSMHSPESKSTLLLSLLTLFSRIKEII